MTDKHTPLKPCPFCGGEAKVQRESGVAGRITKTRWYREYVQCKNEKHCGFSTSIKKRPRAAVVIWNRAVNNHRRLQEENKRLLEALRRIHQQTRLVEQSISSSSCLEVVKIEATEWLEDCRIIAEEALKGGEDDQQTNSG